MHLRRFAIAVVVAAALLTPACESGGEEDNTTTTAGGGSTTTTAAAAGSPQDEATKVTIRDNAFEPSRIEAPKGAVALAVVNTGGSTHTFTMDQPKLDAEIGAGEDTELLASMPTAGQFIFYCRFHRGQGMQGTLVVTE